MGINTKARTLVGFLGATGDGALDGLGHVVGGVPEAKSNWVSGLSSSLSIWMEHSLDVIHCEVWLLVFGSKKIEVS